VSVDSGPSIAANDVIWRLRDVTLAGRTSPRLDHITCDIPRGITAVLGASGAGKTSLLNVLVGVEGRESRVERREPEKNKCNFWPSTLDPPLSTLLLL
jgi:ABC-type Mn2+/Zn2+ transport system ATPase subunit